MVLGEPTQELLELRKKQSGLLEQLDEAQLKRAYIHPDGNELVTLKEGLAIYAWHCNHHLQHIINAKAFKY